MAASGVLQKDSSDREKNRFVGEGVQGGLGDRDRLDPVKGVLPS